MTAFSKINREVSGPIVMPDLPPTLIALAKMLSGPEFGSERFLARMVLQEDRDAGFVDFTLDWLSCLAEGVDIDRRAKNANVQRCAKVALKDLISLVIKRTPTVPELKLHRAAQRNLVPLMLLIELGLTSF